MNAAALATLARLSTLQPESQLPADPNPKPVVGEQAPQLQSPAEQQQPPLPEAGEPAPSEPAPSEPAPTASSNLSMEDIFGVAEDLPEASSEQSPERLSPQPNTSKLEFSLRVSSSAYFDVARTSQRQFGRNENRIEFTLRYAPNRHIDLVGNVEPVFLGVAQAQALDDLATQQLLTPFHVESDAAYVAIYDVLPNLDLKVGRQILVWGTADRFNPTNNLNPDDLEDRPLFTEPIANQMVVADYAPLGDRLWFQGVYVPLFYPALLPPSAVAGLQDPQSPVPYANAREQQAVAQLQGLLRSNDALVPTVAATVRMPRRRFVDGQSAIKLGTSFSGIDASLSYYNGRHDIPMPLRVRSSTKEGGDPATGAQCCYRSDVTLNYPRMQVIGLDFTTQLPLFGDMGLWGEAALIFPRGQDLYIEFPIPVDVTPDNGAADPVAFVEGPAVRSQPFVKATAGLDYTFGKHVYVQAQYLRGFIDEFGAGNIGNYVVGGTDLVFFGRHVVVRAFGVVDFPTGAGDNGSYVLYPELLLVPPWGSVTLDVGSFILLGKSDTKFGQRAAGTSIVFAKVSGAF